MSTFTPIPAIADRFAVLERGLAAGRICKRPAPVRTGPLLTGWRDCPGRMERRNGSVRCATCGRVG